MARTTNLSALLSASPVLAQEVSRHGRLTNGGPKGPYRGPKTPPSEATLARRASEAREAARTLCGVCFTHVLPSGECGSC